MPLLDSIKENAKKLNKRIVLPESMEERTLKAANILIEEGICQVILIGDEKAILNEASKYGLKHIQKATIVNPETYSK
ncbi:MAG: phosphate acetyltransferase, partial [Bacteroidetes bacterium]|nr:phosphate acetyltransferase [Bacteroidota bacterium]